MEFTYDAYANLVSELREHKYQFASYHDYKCFEKCVIMRHDIDYSLEKAVKLAEFEKQLDMKSTYFILVSSPFYNVISADSLSQIKVIQNAGHEIGLHFDELNYTEDQYRKFGGVERAIRKELELLSSVLDSEIRSVSMHRPSKKTLEANYDFGDVVNSYGKEFFDGFKYVSDSRRRWREDVNEVIQSDKYPQLHILTHAFWYNTVERDIKESILAFIDEAKEERLVSLDQNITDLSEIID